MRNFTKIRVHLNEVDLFDKTYIFTFEPIISRMVESIKKIGVTHPPVLGKTSQQPKYRIISGFKRIIALKHLKITDFDAFVYEEDSSQPDLDLFLLNLYENISIRALNLIEISIILNKLILLFKISKEEILENYLPLLGQGKNEKILDILLPLVHLEDNIKIAIIDDFISPDFAGRLLDYTHQDRQAMFNFFFTLKLGKNRQKEFYRLIDDISQIESKPVCDIITQPVIQKILRDEALTISQKVSKMKEELRRQRFPNFSEKVAEFELLKKDLKLPPRIIFRAPPFFESDRYSMEIIFTNQEEFDNALNILKNISTDKKLEILDKS